MHAQRLEPKPYARAQPLNANWDGQSKKIDLVSHISVMIECNGVTTSAAEFKIEVRNGIGTPQEPFSEWQAITLTTPLLVSGNNIRETVLLRQLAFSELRVRAIGDPVGNGNFTIYIYGRGFN